MSSVIVTLKAFGDFVIACGAVNRLAGSGDQSVRILAGYHVQALASALGVHSRVRLIGPANATDAPALFDVRKRGIAAALRSGFHLRADIRQQFGGARMLSVSSGVRERFVLAGLWSIFCPSGGQNVYHDYDKLLIRSGFELLPTVNALPPQKRSAVIFPHARERFRHIPSAVIQGFLAGLSARGFSAKIAAFAPGAVSDDSPAADVVYYNSFDQLVTIMQGAGVVVSADTLTAHLAEYFGIPVFVSTPAPKEYWLPRSTFDGHAWATFADAATFSKWLLRTVGQR